MSTHVISSMNIIFSEMLDLHDLQRKIAEQDLYFMVEIASRLHQMSDSMKRRLSLSSMCACRSVTYIYDSVIMSPLRRSGGQTIFGVDPIGVA